MSEHGNSKYKPEYCEQARKLCLLGATDIKVADFFGVTKTTVNNWKNDHPEFFDSIKKGKDEYDTELVESSLLKRALGYQIVEVKEETGGEVDKTTKTTKQVAGDTTAMIFWLKNRNPDRWRDKQQHEHSGNISHMTDEELDNRLKGLNDAIQNSD